MSPPNIVEMGQVEAVVRVNPDGPLAPPRIGPPTAKRFDVDYRQVAETLSGLRGYAVDAGKVALRVLEGDCQGHYNEACARIEWEVWDKRTPINGVPAREILGRPEYAKADCIYLVRIDGKVVFFQPHAPSFEGVISLTDADVEGYAVSHATKLAESMAFGRMVAELNADPDVVSLPTPAVDPVAIATAVAEQLGSGTRRRQRP